MNKTRNIEEPDLFYDALVTAHKELDRDASEAFNARLIFLLANQIGSHNVLLECLGAAAIANEC
jgi:Protein of unknown function (DUF2783)